MRARSIGAVLAGIAVNVIPAVATDAVLHATGVFAPFGQPMSDGLYALAFSYRLLYGIAGAWLTARLAPSRPMLHAMTLGGIGVVASLAGVIATWNAGPAFGPKWYPLSLVVTALPASWAGARLRIGY